MGRKDIDRLTSRMDAMEERVLHLQKRELLHINKNHELVDTMDDTVDKLNNVIRVKNREISRLKQTIKHYDMIEFDADVVSDYGLRPHNTSHTQRQSYTIPPISDPIKLTSCGCLCKLCSKCQK